MKQDLDETVEDLCLMAKKLATGPCYWASVSFRAADDESFKEGWLACLHYEPKVSWSVPVIVDEAFGSSMQEAAESLLIRCQEVWERERF